jgi:hypothetical protein
MEIIFSPGYQSLLLSDIGFLLGHVENSLNRSGKQEHVIPRKRLKHSDNPSEVTIRNRYKEIVVRLNIDILL